jgi:hypothetical protein
VAAADRVRITAPASIVQLRVEVYDANGVKVWDSEIRGNVFDWHMQDGQAQRPSVGDYVCVVTVKNLAGRVTQKIGSISVGEKVVRVGTIETAQLSAPQSQATGPIEGDSSWTLLTEEQNKTTTVLAYDGTDGQIVRGRGAVSFRLGDFFFGNDKEQMRLTEEGNLGIGTSKPKSKLDVAGTVRAREGFMFNDGSTLNVNDKGVLTRSSADGTTTVTTTTQNRIAKFTDNAGTLGDSVAIDTGTGLQLTAAPSGAVDTNLLYLNSTNGTTGVLAGSVPSYGAVNGPFFAMRGNTYTTIANQRGLFTIAAGNVSSPVGDDGSVKFNTGNDQLRMVIRPNGNVGIGTTSPQDLLNVNGNLRWGGTITNFAYSGQDGSGLFLEQKGVSAATSNVRLQSSKSGNITDYSQFFIDPNNGFSFMKLGTGNGNVGIGTATPQAKLDVRGDVKLGSSGQLFATGGEENLRIVRGVVSANGAILAGGFFSVQQTGPGVFLITFDTPFSGVPALTAIAHRPSDADASTVTIDHGGVTASSAELHIFDGSASANLLFHFIAIGPR